jgi:TonB family protein
VEFKFIPRYYPQDEFVPLPPPEIAYSPKILHPGDPELRDRGADVWVNVLVNRKGIVGKAEIFKSTDEAFNEYAIEYARQYKFRWSGGWPEELKDRKDVWISITVHFGP